MSRLSLTEAVLSLAPAVSPTTLLVPTFAFAVSMSEVESLFATLVVSVTAVSGTTATLSEVLAGCLAIATAVSFLHRFSQK